MNNYRNLESFSFLTSKSGSSILTLTTTNGAIPIINYGDGTGVHSTSFSKTYPDTTIKNVKIFSNQIKQIVGFSINAVNPVQIYGELNLLKLSRLSNLNFNGGINPKLHTIKILNNNDNDNNFSNFIINTTAINGLIDYSSLNNIAGNVGLNNNPNLNYSKEPIAKKIGNIVGTIVYSSALASQNLLGNLDLSIYDNINGAISTNGNPNLYTIVMPQITNVTNNGSHVFSNNTNAPKSKLGGILDISTLLEFGQIEVSNSSIRNIYFPNYVKKTTGLGNCNYSGNNLLGSVDMSGVKLYDDLTFDSYNLNFLFFGRQSVSVATFKLDKNNNILGTLDLEPLIGTTTFTSTTGNDYMFYYNCNAIILPSYTNTPITNLKSVLIGPMVNTPIKSNMSGSIDLSGFNNLYDIVFNQSPRINNVLFPNSTFSINAYNLSYFNNINFKGNIDLSGIKNIGNIRLYDSIGGLSGSAHKLYSQLRYIQFPLNYNKSAYNSTSGLNDFIHYNTFGTINISNMIDAVSTSSIGNINLYTMVYPHNGVVATADSYVNNYTNHIVDISTLKNFVNVNINSKKSNVLLPNNINTNTSTTGSYFIGSISGTSTNYTSMLYKNSELTGSIDLSGITKLNGTNIYIIGGHTSIDTSYTPISDLGGGVSSVTPLTIVTISLRTSPKLNFINNPLKVTSTSFITTDNYYVFSGGLQGILDLTNFNFLGAGASTIASAFHVLDCPNLNTIIFHSNITTSRFFSHFLVNNNGLIGSLDLRQVTNLGGSIQISNNPNISEILFPITYISGVNNITLLNITISSITTLDLSNMSHIGAIVNITNNSLLTSITFPVTISGTAIRYLNLSNNNLTGTLNISSFTSLSTITNNPRFECANNTNLTNLTLPTANIWYFITSGCSLDITYTFGTTINKLVDIQIQNNIMSNSNVDATINNIFNNRGNGNVDTSTFNNTITKTLNISGSNSAPTGTYAMPTLGYTGIIHDKTDAEITTASAMLSVNEKVWVLVNLKISNASSTLRYKLTITTS